MRSWRSHRQLTRLATQVAAREGADSGTPPVAFFNASARLGHLSLNAAFSLLSSWSLRLAGQPVVHFVCRQGMSHCVLGTDADDPHRAPPCQQCIAQSRRLFHKAAVGWFDYRASAGLASALANRSLSELRNFVYQGLPLGQLVLPSVRWALRRHRLADDEDTRYLYRSFIQSAYSLGREFGTFLDQHNPSSLVVFNGIMYPEAMARRLAQERGLRVITHEVGLRPFSAFFTDGEATAYPLRIPADFRLSAEQNTQLDNYLEQRFQGRFSMAGIQFWPQMQALDTAFLEKAARFKHLVPVFTNVIFDTSQVHANQLFRHMFAWLDHVLDAIRRHPDTLFVIRAHPDELRPGKQSRQSVAQWVVENRVSDLDNVVFVDSQEYISSYALIQRAHFVMVYNSSIGLEASILGRPVLCAGAARYTPYPTVFFPRSEKQYEDMLEVFLKAEHVAQPEEYVREARRVFYFQLFRTSLPFEDYLEAHSPGYVRLKSFPIESLLPERSAALGAIHAGLVAGEPFLV